MEKLVPVQGDWTTIENFLRHLFGNNENSENYEWAVNYLKDLYNHPEKRMPVLCLASSELGTGKTTFLHLLKEIFKDDMSIVDSCRVDSHFNSSFAGKSITAIDESFISSYNRRLIDRIVHHATDPKITLITKGKDDKVIDNKSRLIICTNDYRFTEFLKNKQDIFKVFISHHRVSDPNFWEKLQSEIPAFLWFLENE